MHLLGLETKRRRQRGLGIERPPEEKEAVGVRGRTWRSRRSGKEEERGGGRWRTGGLRAWEREATEPFLHTDLITFLPSFLLSLQEEVND